MIIRLLNFAALCAVIYVNYLANALPINGKTTGELSDNYVNLFVPAGLTFAIWGLIYLLLMIFSVVQFIPKHQFTAIRPDYLFMFSCVFNIAWILAWHYELMAVSILNMLALLASLALINLHLANGNQTLLKLIFGVYLGWILIATVANFTAGLVSVGWSGWGLPEVGWTIIMIAAGLAVAAFCMIKLNNPFLAVAVSWAFLGIYLKRASDQPMIAYFALFAMTGTILAAAYVVYRMRNSLLA